MLRVVLDIAGDHTQVDITGEILRAVVYTAGAVLPAPGCRRRDAGMPAQRPQCKPSFLSSAAGRTIGLDLPDRVGDCLAPGGDFGGEGQ